MIPPFWLFSFFMYRHRCPYKSSCVHITTKSTHRHKICTRWCYLTRIHGAICLSPQRVTMRRAVDLRAGWLACWKGWELVCGLPVAGWVRKPWILIAYAEKSCGMRCIQANVESQYGLSNPRDFAVQSRHFDPSTIFIQGNFALARDRPCAGPTLLILLLDLFLISRLPGYCSLTLSCGPLHPIQ